MPTLDFSIDLHCHPNYKPLGRSYRRTPGQQAASPNDKASMWYYDPPSPADKLLNKLAGLTKFSQTNLTASLYGNVWVMAVSLGSIEKWFFCNRDGDDGLFKDLIVDFATGLGRPRINAIQGMQDYWDDLKKEYDFIEQMQGKVVLVDGQKLSYRFVHNFEELEALMQENEAAIKASLTLKRNEQLPITLAFIPTIEGLHVLNCGLDADCIPDKVIENAYAIKNHPHRPWFVTFSHHFYNELCGHARSLSGKVARTCDQNFGLGTGFTNLGWKVLDILLDDTEGKRILIDLKHLSPRGRREFIAHRDKKYPDLPLVISHGACNGLPDMDTPRSKYPELGKYMNDGEINFYDEEILALARSKGIMGLQLDERRIASAEGLKRVRDSLALNKRMHYRSELLWKQVQYIAELLDDQGLFAWGTAAMGSDYDGLVDPVNTFWTFEEYTDLKSYMERHAHNYISNHSGRLKNGFNKIDADLIVQNLFQLNAWNFFKQWFRKKESGSAAEMSFPGAAVAAGVNQ